MTITKDAIDVAMTAFNKTLNEPIMDKCERCDGRGYHHGFGEDGADPDWCEVCGGGGYNLRPGEENRAMSNALESALPFLSTLPIDEAKFLLDRLSELEWSDVPDDFWRDWNGHVEPSIARLRLALSSPGKDGGQGRILPDNEDFRQGYSVGYADAYGDVSDLKAKLTALKGAHSPQPASTALVERLTKALEPFADACFNDNGDITVDLSFAKAEDFIKAYFVHKRSLSASQSTSREGESR